MKGDQIVKVVKQKYGKEIYPTLFGDCAEFMRMYPVEKKMYVSGFAESVTDYNKLCASK